MDLNTITAIERPRRRDDLKPFVPGDAFLAGGTWLFSEPQPRLSRLIDLTGLQWEPLMVSSDGLSIAATCTVAALDALEPPPGWQAGPLIGQCCRAFLASFKIWNTATVGGNLCMALPAGPMIALCVALEAACVIWTPDGGQRSVPAVDFVLGPQQTVLRPAEVLRSIEVPRRSLMRRTAFRQVSLTPLGRSGALLIGTLPAEGGLVLTVTGSTPRPVRIAFEAVPHAAGLRARLDAAVGPTGYFDDVHGAPAWRRQVTRELAEEIRAELAGDPA